MYERHLEKETPVFGDESQVSNLNLTPKTFYVDNECVDQTAWQSRMSFAFPNMRKTRVLATGLVLFNSTDLGQVI